MSAHDLIHALNSLETRLRGRNFTDRQEAEAILNALEGLRATVRATIRVPEES